MAALAEAAADQVEAVEAILTGLGADSVTLLETGDEPMVEPAPRPEPPPNDA